MILPRRESPGRATVERHYDDLDRWYREIWGEHVHHGLWTRGDESAAEAVEALVRRVADEAGIGPGSEVCDIGSGYGATARQLTRERDARVTAITLSPAQHRLALERGSVRPGSPRYRLGDWLENELPAGSFDVGIAVESSTHMSDLDRALIEASRVLRPGGRFVACVWLAREGAGSLERRHLLEPICREGRLARLTTAGEYTDALERAGFAVTRVEDLSHRVRRTWTLCIAEAVRRIASDREARRFLLDRTQPERVFARTLVRIWTAYRTGSLRYGLFTAERR